jgi:hypothetical protein
MDLQTPRGHDLTLLLEFQELTPAQRITRNCERADWIEKLQAATSKVATENPFCAPAGVLHKNNSQSCKIVNIDSP